MSVPTEVVYSFDRAPPRETEGQAAKGRVYSESFRNPTKLQVARQQSALPVDSLAVRCPWEDRKGGTRGILVCSSVCSSVRPSVRQSVGRQIRRPIRPHNQPADASKLADVERTLGNKASALRELHKRCYILCGLSDVPCCLN